MVASKLNRILSWFNLRLPRTCKKVAVQKNDVVLITGCDSGLGHFAARKCFDTGFTVVATVLNKDSVGTQKLLKEIGDHDNRFHVVEMDLKADDSINSLFDFVSSVITKDDLNFHALINNAGVMCFGEFEWLNPGIIEEEIRINLVGPMMLVNLFLPVLRQHKSRIINVTSHCSLKALPGLSVYSASKAGFRFWTEALEKELHKFGVNVVNFIPGSFIMSSNIVARTMVLSKSMKNGLSDNQLNTYETYFDQYYGYLNHVAEHAKTPAAFDPQIISKLMDAILDESPKYVYKVEPWRYKFYYNLFKIIPQGPIERWFIDKFMMMPKMVQEGV